MCGSQCTVKLQTELMRPNKPSVLVSESDAPVLSCV